MRTFATFALAASSLLGAVNAAAAPTCGGGTKCPEDTPCCSAYGQCGVGAYCLGGCDPISSNTLDSCVPRPVCSSENYKLTSLSGISPNTVYLGDASKANWVSEGTPVVYQDNSILLTMAQNTVGTLLSSTHYVWYGKISARLRTSGGQGVVTAFIMMSDVKDEIDFEFVGVDLQAAQSNFYWQGVLNYTNAENLTTSNTNSNWHTYTFDWKPDSLTWLIDDQPMRTLLKTDTYNSSRGVYNYPQTPSRIMLSLWPAGLASNGQGTVDWAGGLIQWDSPYMSNGYYYAQVAEVDVECYNPPPGADVQGSVSYVYTDIAALNNSVEITDDSTVLGSFYATGQNQQFNPNAKKPSGNKATSTGPAPIPATSGVQTVPGDTGAGQRGSTDSGNGANGFNGGSGYGGSSDGTGFSQGTGGNGNAAAPGMTVHGSMFAILVALCALVML